MGIDKSDITVIIPMYNSEKTISKVLYSIINQTCVEYIGEIIVVNDGSRDESRQIVEKISKISPVRINIINCENGGVSKARNIGFSMAKTKWIALCDSDDVWLKNKIEHQVEILSGANEIDFLGGNHVSSSQKIFMKEIKTLKRVTVADLCFKTLPQTSTAIFKRKILDSIGGYDEKQRYAEDGNFFMRIAANFNYYYDPIQVVLYGDGKEGFGDSGLSANIKEMHKGLLKNFKEMKELKYISLTCYCGAVIFEMLKYIRRKIIVLKI